MLHGSLEQESAGTHLRTKICTRMYRNLAGVWRAVSAKEKYAPWRVFLVIDILSDESECKTMICGTKIVTWGRSLGHFYRAVTDPNYHYI